MILIAMTPNGTKCCESCGRMDFDTEWLEREAWENGTCEVCGLDCN